MIFFAWPLFLYLYLVQLDGNYQGNYQLLLNHELIILIVIILSGILVAIGSLIIFVQVIKHEKKSITQIKRKIKLVQ